eukprot:1480475-Ditylum_brightwellii.AAC.2
MEGYVAKKVEDWVDAINIFAEMMPHQPQAAFAGYACSLQFEWAYIQRAIEVEERLFEPLEKAINYNLLPALFETNVIPPDLCKVTSLLCKHGGIGDLDPCREMALNRLTSKASTSHLVDAILGLDDFKQDVHQATMEAGRAGRIRRKEETYKGVRETVEEDYTSNQVQGLDRASKSLNHWILVVPCLANNSILGKDGFRDMIMYCYRITPKDLPAICGGCDKQHSLQHALQRKSGSLILGCHDDACNDLGHLSTQAYSPSSIHNNPQQSKNKIKSGGQEWESMLWGYHDQGGQGHRAHPPEA